MLIFYSWRNLSVSVTHFIVLQRSEFCWFSNVEMMYKMQIKTKTTLLQLVELSKIIFLEFFA